MYNSMYSLIVFVYNNNNNKCQVKHTPKSIRIMCTMHLRVAVFMYSHVCEEEGLLGTFIFYIPYFSYY